MSDHIHILPARHSEDLRLYTAALTRHARGASAGGQAAADGALRGCEEGKCRVPGTTLERNGRKGPREQTDQGEIQRMLSKHSDTTLLTMKKKERASVVA